MPTRKYLTLAVIGILVISLPIVLYLSQQQQDIRQQASEIITCDTLETFKVGQKTSKRTNDRKVKREELRMLISTYRRASRESQTALRQQLRQQLTDRKKHLIETMRSNPKEALKEIQETKETKDLAKVSTNCIEQLTSIKGTAHVQVTDFSDETAHTQVAITTADKKQFVLTNPEETAEPLYSGAEVTTQGYALDQAFLVSPSVETTITNNAAPLLQAALATKKIAVILVNFTNTQTVLTKNQIISEFSQANSFHQENSYGRVSFTPTFHGFYQLPVAAGCTNTPEMASAAMNAANNEVNFQDYQNVMIVSTYPSTCGWAGIGDVGMIRRATPDGNVTLGLSFVSVQYIRGAYQTMAHEVGHNLGAYHAGFGNDTYGDTYDIMGGQIGQMSIGRKEQLGLTLGSEVTQVKTNGTYTIIPLESQATGSKGIKIDAGTKGIYHLEYRQPLGVDAQFSELYPGTTVFQGALLHSFDPKARNNTSNTILLDTTNSLDPNTVALLPNRPYTLPSTSIKVTVTQRTSTSLTVSVSGMQTVTPLPSPSPSPTASQFPSISGDLFIDTNKNNIRDTGDSVYTNQNKLELRKYNADQTSSTLVQTVTSTSNGTYTIPNVTQGDYELKIILPPTYSSRNGNPINFTMRANRLIINFPLEMVTITPSPTRPVSPTRNPSVTLSPTSKPPTPTLTKTPSPTLTRTPSPTTITPSPTVTRPPSPTSSIPTVITPTPTLAASQSILKFSLLLHGLGKAGDNTYPGSDGNLNPVNKTKTASVLIVNTQTQAQERKNVTITYNQSQGNFIGELHLPSFQTGKYIVSVTVPKYLTKQYSGILSLSQGLTNTLPSVSLVVGDINTDNRLDILDYDLLITCYEATTAVCNATDKANADLNDDGNVDQFDLNLFLREITVQSGNSL